MNRARFAALLAVAILLPTTMTGCSKKGSPTQPAPARAWVQTSGPSTESVWALTGYGSDVVAGTIHSTQRTTDAGESWSLVLSRDAYNFAAIGPVLFAGTLEGVFRSPNSLDWVGVNNGLPSTRIVYSLAARGGTLWAGVSGGPVFKSTDQGGSWNPASTGLPAGAEVNALLARTSDLFASAGAGEMFRSTNDGASWAPANSGLPGSQVLALLASGGNVFAGTSANGVYVSTDNGASWNPSSSGMSSTAHVQALAIANGNLYALTSAGLFRSSTGASWTEVATGLPSSTPWRSLTTAGTTIYAGTEGRGAVRSSDDVTWTLAGPQEGSLAQSVGFANGVLLAGVPFGGIYRSTDRGVVWQLSSATSQDVWVFAAHGSAVFAGAQSVGVLRSVNGGVDWSPVTTGLPAGADVAALASNGTALVAAVDASGAGSIFRTTDNGDHWNATSGLPASPTVLSLTASGTRLFAGVASGGAGAGVYRSTDDGATWGPASTGLPSGALVRSMAASGTRIYAGTAAGVYTSTDGGDTWTATGLTSGDVTALAANGAQVLALADTHTLLRSFDSGATWSSAANGLAGEKVEAVAAGTDEFYAATTAAVWRLAY